MTTRAKITARPDPTDREIAAVLGPISPVWRNLLTTLETRFAPVARQWKPSEKDFGRMLLLKRRARTLVYLTPEDGCIAAAVVLGEKAVAVALQGALPEAVKSIIRTARAYAEGRGIRLTVSTPTGARVVAELVSIKLGTK